jgi:hypothetical protein
MACLGPDFAPLWDAFGDPPEGQGFRDCAKTRFACHSEESAILIGGRRGISHCLENTQSDPPRRARSARNDSLDGVFTQALQPRPSLPW